MYSKKSKLQLKFLYIFQLLLVYSQITIIHTTASSNLKVIVVENLEIIFI